MERQIMVELLTPLFIAGAEVRTPRPEAEGLRAPSLRGAMRFWFRAGAGLPFGSLRQREAELFGATQPKPRGSPVSLQTQTLDGLQGQEWWQRDQGGGSQQPYLRNLQQQYPGVAYLAFSAREQWERGGRTLKERPRKSIQPGARFRVVLRQLYGAEDALRSWEASLWLWCHLGGLGSRSRRGFGSLWPLGVDGESSVGFLFRDGTLQGLRDFLQQGIGSAIGTLRQPGATLASNYNVLAKGQARVYVAAPKEGRWRRWEEALDQFGLRLMAARRQYHPNLADVEQFLNSGRALPSLNRASFGLPVMYFRDRPGFSATLSLMNPEQPGVEGRRASPLLAKVARLGTSSYALVLTVFFSPFMEEGRSLTIKGKKIDGEPPLQPLSDFVRRLTSADAVAIGPPGKTRRVPLVPLHVLEVPLP